MSKNLPMCPQCNVAMEPGFQPDFTLKTDTYSIQQSCWHPGSPEDRRFLGVTTGVSLDKSALRKVVAYCCPECGLLLQYAEKL